MINKCKRLKVLDFRKVKQQVINAICGGCDLPHLFSHAVDLVGSREINRACRRGRRRRGCFMRTRTRLQSR